MHGAIGIDAAWMTTVLLLSLRLSAVLLLTPVLAAANVPVTVRVLVVLALAAALSLALPREALTARASDLLGSPGVLLRAATAELTLGATLALGILLGFAAFSVAGALLGVQMGFGLGQVIDPATGASTPLLASAFDQLAVVVFFLIDGHHALVRGVAYSLERFPLGRSWPLEAAFEPVVRQVAGLFGLGVALAAPVAFALLLLEVALGVLARNLPQLNMLALGIPLKVAVGLVALSLWFGGVRDVMLRAYAGIFRSWDALLQDAPSSGGAAASGRGAAPPVEVR